MALEIEKLTKCVRSQMGVPTVTGIIMKLPDDILSWLTGHIGPIERERSEPYNNVWKNVVYKGNGWRTSAHAELYSRCGYWLYIDDDALALQFKLTWL